MVGRFNNFLLIRHFCEKKDKKRKEQIRKEMEKEKKERNVGRGWQAPKKKPTWSRRRSPTRSRYSIWCYNIWCYNIWCPQYLKLQKKSHVNLTWDFFINLGGDRRLDPVGFFFGRRLQPPKKKSYGVQAPVAS